ncbi:hypothetical protein [Nocardia beijingensis]|uniref:hypothetical protein n=1 Tax=Nocardia beijingensis TaxID=95162 RepID=UPI0033C1EA2B
MSLLGRLFEKRRRGAVAADLAGFLETAHSKIHPGEATGRTDGLSNVELTVLSEVDNSLARSDQKSGRVRANGTKLQKAAHNAALRWSELSRERDHPGWQLRRLEQPPSRFAQPRPIPESAVAAPAQRELFDHNQWMSPQWVLFTFETIFVLAEGFFWYQAFSQTAEPGLNLGQFAAVLLALLVPAAALYVSYGAAKLLHRRIRRHGASDRLTTIGIGAWLALFLAILIAIMVLVNWRFTPGAGLEFGGVEIPPQPMAIAFGAVLACDLLARTFLVSEIRTQYEKRRRNFRKLARKYLKAARKHHVAWARLSNAVQSNLDQSRRIETAGARLLSHAEAFFGDAYKINSLPPKVGALRAHDRAAQAGLDEVARVSPQDDAGRGPARARRRPARAAQHRIAAADPSHRPARPAGHPRHRDPPADQLPGEVAGAGSRAGGRSVAGASRRAAGRGSTDRVQDTSTADRDGRQQCRHSGLAPLTSPVRRS